MPSYGQEIAKSEKETPQLEAIHYRFTNQNDRQVGLLNELEEKMHKIHSKRNPNKENGADKNMPNDAIQSFNDQLNRLTNQNDWLEKLVSHISEII